MVLVKLRDACRALDLSPNTVRKYGDQGLIPCVRTDGNHRLFDVDAYLQSKNISESIRFDAIADFFWDAKSQRYKWRSGAGKGQFASKAQIFARTRNYIKNQEEKLIEIADDLATGAINFGEAQRKAVYHLKQIHISHATLGKGGYENMRSNDWLRVGREIKRQTISGKASDGKRFGLKYLFSDVKNKKVSVNQFRDRLKKYAQSGKISYWDAWKSDRDGQIMGIRVLGGNDNHCPFCLAQAAMRPRLIRDIPTIGCCPQCLTNCNCSILELSRNEAQELSDRWPTVAA